MCTLSWLRLLSLDPTTRWENHSPPRPATQKNTRQPPGPAPNGCPSRPETLPEPAKAPANPQAPSTGGTRGRSEASAPFPVRLPPPGDRLLLCKRRLGQTQQTGQGPEARPAHLPAPEGRLRAASPGSTGTGTRRQETPWSPLRPPAALRPFCGPG